MWRYVKWGLRIFLLLIVAGFLHYTLPQHDIVRVIGTYNRVTTLGENAIFYASPDTGSAEGTATRDIRFIQAAFADGSKIEYRNEDTGWVWPPYFKYDSSNLQAEAADLESKPENPKWVSVTHYGWQFPLLSIYPNAVGIKAVAGPDVRIIPWLNIVILTTLLVVALMLRRMWLQFRERMVDPTLAEVDASVGAARAQASGFFGRIGAWLRTWRK